MWPIFSDKLKVTSVEGNPKRLPLRLTELVEKVGDFSDFQWNDVALKFWLPEPAEQALNEMGERTEITTSEFLRQFFTIHCYGLYIFYAMKDFNPDFFKEAVTFYDTDSTIGNKPGKKRVETYWVPELGKNIAPIKVWMPTRLKEDLSTLATHSKLTLSNYVREIVISRLLGQGMLPSRPETFQVSATPAADAWCEGKEVNWRKVKKAEHIKRLVSEVRYEFIEENTRPTKKREAGNR